jgi:hypothetical protein
MIRSILAVAAGSITAFLTYWLGAVVALLATHGIPLGSAGGAPTAADIAVHVSLAGAATFGGARLAIRIARPSPRVHATVVGLLLAAGAIAGFDKTSSSWPAWFGPAIAAACIIGAFSAVQWGKRMP